MATHMNVVKFGDLRGQHDRQTFARFSYLALNRQIAYFSYLNAWIFLAIIR